MKTLTHESRFLGRIEYGPDDVYSFPQGVAGYPKHHRYLLVESGRTQPAQWLVCLDEGGPELALIDPQLLGESPMEDQDIGGPALRRIRAHRDDDVRTLCVLTVPDQIRKTSINLRTPILLNPATKLGTQCLLGEQTRRPLRKEVYADLVMPDDPQERSGMVITHRKVNETLEIGPEVTVSVLEIADGGVRLGVCAPRRVAVTRGRHAMTPAEENQRANEEMNVGYLESLMRIFGARNGHQDEEWRGAKAPMWTMTG